MCYFCICISFSVNSINFPILLFCIFVLTSRRKPPLPFVKYLLSNWCFHKLIILFSFRSIYVQRVTHSTSSAQVNIWKSSIIVGFSLGKLLWLFKFQYFFPVYHNHLHKIIPC